MNGPAKSPQSMGGAKASWLVYGCSVFVGVFEAICIYSTLTGLRPVGAYQGFAVAVLAALGASALIRSKPARRHTLARAAVVASLVAVVGALLIPARVAEAQGALPPGVPVGQTVLLMLFQLGWATTHWLGSERRVRGNARHMPAATGTVLLLLGGFMLGRASDGGAGSTPAAERGVVYEVFPSPEDLAFANQSEVAGQPEGSDFAHYHAEGQPLLGVSFSTRDWFRRERIDGDFRAIFERDAVTEGAHVVVAPEGYIVAGLEVQADDNVSALRVQFAPYDGTFVSPFDRYWSDWYGGYDRGENGTRLDGASTLIVGLRGTTGLVLNSLSLLTAK